MGLRRYLSNLFRHVSNTKRQLNDITRSLDGQQKEFVILKELHRKSYLQDKVLHCTEKGVSTTKLCEEEVIVSLTSYGPRISEVYLAIESIMQGTVKPNRIILWLDHQYSGGALPMTLQNQQKRGLEVEFCKDVRSYTKLIPALGAYPDAAVITIDDDIMYDFDFVENLVRTHIDRPECVCANRIHKIKLDETGHPISYMGWDMCSSDSSDSNLNFLTGVGGVLYPPHVFPQEVFNEDVYLKICPQADDVWFYSMLLMNKKQIIKSFTHSATGCDYIDIIEPQGIALSATNTDPNDCKNDVQIKAVFDKYQLYSYLI